MLKIFKNPDELAFAAAEKFVVTANLAVAKYGLCTLALSGGSTPLRTYEILSREFKQNIIDWSKVHFFFGDERKLLPDSPLSNYKNANDVLFSKINLPPENIHRIRSEGSLKNAAEEYEKEIEEFFTKRGRTKQDDQDESVPEFDFVFLGIGDDGHIASLFPKTEALSEYHKLVVANEAPQLEGSGLPTKRITMTFKLLNAAAYVLFLVSGRAKAEVVSEILGQSSKLFPAKMLRNPNTDWYLDADAAGKLPQGKVALE